MKCIFHCDLDGRCAGAIVAYFTNNYNKFQTDPLGKGDGVLC